MNTDVKVFVFPGPSHLGTFCKEHSEICSIPGGVTRSLSPFSSEPLPRQPHECTEGEFENAKALKILPTIPTQDEKRVPEEQWQRSDYTTPRDAGTSIFCAGPIATCSPCLTQNMVLTPNHRHKWGPFGQKRH